MTQAQAKPACGRAGVERLIGPPFRVEQINSVINVGKQVFQKGGGHHAFRGAHKQRVAEVFAQMAQPHANRGLA